MLHSLLNTSDARPKYDSTTDIKKNDAKPPSWLLLEGDINPRTSAHGLSSKKWAVDFASSYVMMKEALLESYIKRKFGKLPYRIWRIVDEKGKMEEKQVGPMSVCPLSRS